VKLLVQAAPPEQASKVESALTQAHLTENLHGPVVDETRTDVVNNQGEVDDLLASLGF
jgi:chemotaxis protein CheZ